MNMPPGFRVNPDAARLQAPVGQDPHQQLMLTQQRVQDINLKTADQQPQTIVGMREGMESQRVEGDTAYLHASEMANTAKEAVLGQLTRVGMGLPGHQRLGAMAQAGIDPRVLYV